MEIIADLHIHSKYSRAVSRNMTLPVMTQFARQKGLGLLTTGDWTHPLWLREIKQNLVEDTEGVYKLKESRDKDDPKFVLSVEVSSIYSQGGTTRRIHTLLFAPNVKTAEKFNAKLVKRGANITSDGRPIVGITPPELLEMLMEIDERSFLIPCHVWTPWFSLYGSMSGFDSIEDCFGKYSKYIYGVETGLSSDPVMNWRIEELKSRSILSNSDSHSPMKMGREANVFELEKLTYENLKKAIKRENRSNRIKYTVEFYPEEGKYHFSGHRNCGVSFSPDELAKNGISCPKCKKGLTVGVMNRVEDLAGSDEKVITQIGKSGVKWYMDPDKNFPPYAKLVPLIEIISEVIGMGVASMKVKNLFDEMINSLGSEFEILMKTPTDVIEKKFSHEMANAISHVRTGDIFIKPGFDGEYGIVKINKGEQKEKKVIPTEQKSLL